MMIVDSGMDKGRADSVVALAQKFGANLCREVATNTWFWEHWDFDPNMLDEVVTFVALPDCAENFLQWALRHITAVVAPTKRKPIWVRAMVIKGPRMILTPVPCILCGSLSGHSPDCGLDMSAVAMNHGNPDAAAFADAKDGL